jgi:nucleoside recognition membrane protein YjiH
VTEHRARARDWIWFVVPSVAGILMFLVPVSFRGEPNIGIGVLSDLVEAALEGWLPTLVTLIVTVSAAGGLIAAAVRARGGGIPVWLARLFVVSWPMAGVRLVGAVLAWMVLLERGPEWVVSADTGGVILNDLMTVIFVMFVFAALLLPLLTDFGLMEFAGTLVRPFFRPVFTLPGRSSIDALASWFGSAPVGVILTIGQYEAGYYTAREAAVIASSFSVVSLAFAVVIIDFVGLANVFLPFYATLVVAGALAAVALPRLWPLRSKLDDHFEGKQPMAAEKPPADSSLFGYATSLALRRAHQAPPAGQMARQATSQVLDIWIGLEPVVMVIGTVGLALAVYTPLFDWISMPFVPLLRLFALPDAAAAAPAMVVGFADQFLPVILAQSIASPETRFVLACMAVTQLIYMSEVGALLLRSSVPLGFGDLFAIFLWRTLITLPVCAAAAHLLF